MKELKRAWARGGRIGGAKRAANLSPERRREIARMGGQAAQAKRKANNSLTR